MEKIMTYEEFSNLLWEKHALKGKWHEHEIDVMQIRNHVYVRGIVFKPIETFTSLSEALDQWSLDVPLWKIIRDSKIEDWEENRDFYAISLLDPELFSGYTELLHESSTRGAYHKDSPIELSSLAIAEQERACLYGVNFGERIYHTIEWRYLKEVLDNERILLRDPRTYNDKWESFLLEGVKEGVQASNDQFWGIMCWSRREESEGLWNNLVRGEKGDDASNQKSASQPEDPIGTQRVKIETTVAELLLAATQSLHMPDLWRRCRIGRVKYYDEFRIIDFRNQVLSLPDAELRLETFGNAYLQSLFMKRQPFDYEQEVRLVVQNSDKFEQYGNPKGFFLQWAPKRLIHEIVVNPGCCHEHFKIIKEELRERGFHRVRQSNLAKPFPFAKEG